MVGKTIFYDVISHLNSRLFFTWWVIIVESFVVKASLLPQIQRIATHNHLSKKGVEKPDKLVNLSPGLLHSLINSKEILGMELVKQDQRLTGSWLVFFLWLLKETDFSFLIKTFTAQDSQYWHWWSLEGLDSHLFVHFALETFL